MVKDCIPDSLKPNFLKFDGWIFSHVHVHFSKLLPFAVIKNGLLLNMFDHSSLIAQSIQYQKNGQLGVNYNKSQV